jgi:hypothetical protein
MATVPHNDSPQKSGKINNAKNNSVGLQKRLTPRRGDYQTVSTRNQNLRANMREQAKP